MPTSSVRPGSAEAREMTAISGLKCFESFVKSDQHGSWLKTCLAFCLLRQGMVIEKMLSDLEAEGFEVCPPFIIPACAVNAPHTRLRAWIVAHNHGNGKLSLFEGAEEKSEPLGEAKAFLSHPPAWGL